MAARIGTVLVVLCLGLATFSMARPATAQVDAAWLAPIAPFRIAGNLYYVGSQGLASYLIATPQGHILINSNLEASVPMLQKSVEALGFAFTDIRVLLISHAHWDHSAGSAAIKRLTGATYMVMDADVPVVESGGRADVFYGRTPSLLFPATTVDKVLHDGDAITMAGSTLVAHLTPGHTKGCTTWTMTVADGGTSYDVVIVGSPYVNPGYKLVKNTAYPTIATDYAKTFRVLKSLKADIFLGAHGSYFDMDAKIARTVPGGANPFVDPAGYAGFVASSERAFQTELARQRGSTK